MKIYTRSDLTKLIGRHGGRETLMCGLCGVTNRYSLDIDHAVDCPLGDEDVLEIRLEPHRALVTIKMKENGGAFLELPCDKLGPDKRNQCGRCEHLAACAALDKMN
jgi:hypothetical protein